MTCNSLVEILSDMQGVLGSIPSMSMARDVMVSMCVLYACRESSILSEPINPYSIADNCDWL